MSDARELPVIRKDIVVLRGPRAGELDALADAIAADPAASRWWSDDPLKMRRWLAEETMFVVEAEGDVAGVIGFTEEDDPDYRSAGIDIALLSSATGAGLGTAALTTLAKWLIAERGHHRLTIDPALANERAIHVYEKVGFRRIGVAHAYERGPDGTWHDNLLMELLATEFPEEMTE